GHRSARRRNPRSPRARHPAPRHRGRRRPSSCPTPPPRFPRSSSNHVDFQTSCAYPAPLMNDWHGKMRLPPGQMPQSALVLISAYLIRAQPMHCSASGVHRPTLLRHVRVAPAMQPGSKGAPIMPSDTMTAAYIEQPGPPEAIQIGQLPIPTPGPTDVLVRVETVAVD